MAPRRAQRDRHLREPQTLSHTLRAGWCETRLEILCVLAGGPIHVTAIAERLPASVPTVSRNLAVLLPGDYVRFVREGRKHIYELGSAARVSIGRDGPVAELDSDDGGGTMVRLGPAYAALIKDAIVARREGDRQRTNEVAPNERAPFSRAPAPRPGGVPAPRGGAPTAPRRPSER